MNGYDAAYLAAAPFFLTAAGYKRWRFGKYRHSLPGMFGANLPAQRLAKKNHRVWMHSASFGETIGSGAVYKVLKARHADWEFISTTTTETGQEQSKKSLAGADYRDFVPVDLSWKVRSFLDAYQPSVYCFFETEIWPNILLECGRRNIKTFLVNGDLSDKSSRNYKKLRAIFRKPLASVTAFLMQTEEDANRIANVIESRENIFVTGNVKFDNLPATLTVDEREGMRASWGVPPEAFLVVAGSTHDTEERIIATAFDKLKRVVPSARLVIAPRHPERFNAVLADLKSTGTKVENLYNPSLTPSDAPVLVLNQMGILSRAFGAADIAVVGGAWKPIGGHNLLEPAAHGVAVVHGPHMHEQKEIMQIIRSHDASVSVEAGALGESLIRLANDAPARLAMGQRGAVAALANRGAALRSVELIERFL